MEPQPQEEMEVDKPVDKPEETKDKPSAKSSHHYEMPW